MKKWRENKTGVSHNSGRKQHFPWEWNRLFKIIRIIKKNQPIISIQISKFPYKPNQLQKESTNSKQTEKRVSWFPSTTQNSSLFLYNAIPLVGPPTMITATTLSSELPISHQKTKTPRSLKPPTSNLLSSYVTELKSLLQSREEKSIHKGHNPDAKFMWFVHGLKNHWITTQQLDCCRAKWYLQEIGKREEWNKSGSYEVKI